MGDELVTFCRMFREVSKLSHCGHMNESGTLQSIVDSFICEGVQEAFGQEVRREEVFIGNLQDVISQVGAVLEENRFARGNSFSLRAAKLHFESRKIEPEPM